MNRDDEALCMLQVELNLERAKKKPFTKGDVLLLKVVTAILSERLFKFAILEDVSKDQAGVDRYIKFVQEVSKFDSQKKFQRNLE